MPYGVLRRFCRAWDQYRCLGIIMMLSLTLIMSGCGNWLFEDPSSPENTRTTQNGAPPPPGNIFGTSSSSAPPATTAPSYVSHYVDPLLETPPLELNPNGSLGALGLNLDTYFAHNLDGMHTNEARITRLENVLSAMQKDLRRMAPPIQRLISIESDIKALVTQLSQLAQTEPEALAPDIPPETAAKPPAATKTAPPPASTATHTATGAKPSVQNIRLGEHTDKTRIVLDVSSTASYTYDLDNSENLLVIELPGTSWAAQSQWQGNMSPLIASYSATAAENGGSRLVIQLKNDATVMNDFVIKAEHNAPYRIILDLGRR